MLKSKKLEREELEKEAAPIEENLGDIHKCCLEQCNKPVQIKIIDCCNDYIAILQDEIESTLSIPDDQKYKPEGVVVGVGPGIPSADRRFTPPFNIGDRVIFSTKHVATILNTESGFYSGKRLILVSERSIFCKNGSVECVHI